MVGVSLWECASSGGKTLGWEDFPGTLGLVIHGIPKSWTKFHAQKLSLQILCSLFSMPGSRAHLCKSKRNCICTSLGLSMVLLHLWSLGQAVPAQPTLDFRAIQWRMELERSEVMKPLAGTSLQENKILSSRGKLAWAEGGETVLKHKEWAISIH